MSLLSSKQQMGVAALIIGISVLFSRFMGLLRDKVISWEYGASGETDVYFAAFTIPDFLNYLLAGAYISITLIPILSKLFSNESEEGQESAWRFFSAAVFWATFIISILTLMAWLNADSLTALIAPGLDDLQQERLRHFLAIILPAQIFFLPGACFSALLYVRKQFIVPALMPLIYNGFIILCGVLFPYFGLAEGMEGFCYGVLMGSFFGAFFLPYLAVKQGGLCWKICFKHSKLKHFLILAFPLMIGQSIVVLDEQFIRIFGSMVGEGAVTLLNYARRIMMVPVGVVAQAAGVASFPFLAALIAQGNKQEFAITLQRALKNSIIIVLPLTAFMIAVAKPTLGFIFEGGQFTQEHTILVTPLLQIMLIGVPFWVLQQVLGRAFYAMEDMWTPALLGTAVTLLVLPLYFYLIPLKTEGLAWYWRFITGSYGVALITSLSVMLYAFCLIFCAYRKFSQAFSGVTKCFLQNACLCLIPFIATWKGLEFFSQYLMQKDMHLLLSQFLQLSLCGLVFLAVYLLSITLFLPENIQILITPFRRFIKNKKN